MINYYPIQNRKPLIEQCILQAFKDTYKSQEESLNAEMKDGILTEQTSALIHESFKLSKLNQDYQIGNSALFTDTVSLFNKMYEVEPTFFRASDERRNNQDIKYIDPHHLDFDGRDFDINQIDTKMTYIDAIKFIHALYKSSPDTIYGVMLSTGNNKFFNPLHPLNAQAFVRKYSMDKHESEFMTESSKAIYTVIIYSYKDKLSLKKYNERLFVKQYENLFMSHLLSVLALMDNQKRITTKITQVYTLSQTKGSINPNLYDTATFDILKYSYDIIENPSSNEYPGDVYIQPVQLINTGLAYPFYGITAVKYIPGDSARGYQLSPMQSCNVGESYAYKAKDGSVEVPAGSVCTGNYNNRSPEGRATLNHANLSSAFFNSVMSTGAYTFADTCVKLSLSIYAEFFGLDPISIASEPEVKIPISFEEFKRKNKDATLVQYLASIKG